MWGDSLNKSGEKQQNANELNPNLEFGSRMQIANTALRDITSQSDEDLRRKINAHIQYQQMFPQLYKARVDADSRMRVLNALAGIYA